MARLSVGASGVPAGIYSAEFTRIEETNHPEYGDGLMWVFTIDGGMHDGEEVSRTTKPAPTLKNSCGKFLAALSGQKLTKDLEVDPDDYRGQMFQVIVEESPSGASTRIASFIRQQ